MALRIGIDVGGTNTDAALLSATHVVATAKAPSTSNVVSGIVHSIEWLRSQTTDGLAGVSAVMIGTTQFVNAIIEHKSLCKVLVVRLCGTSTAALPPFVGMPGHTQQLFGGYLLASGGYEYDGITEISPLSAREDAARAVEMLLQGGARAVVVCGVHAPVNPAQELAFAAQLQEQLQRVAPGHPAHITMSHKLSGRLGLLEREAAAILNASLQPLAAAVIPQYSAALQQLGLQDVALYLTGNDGTLLSAADAQEYPILTFKSGPVNSVRGAAYLAGLRDGLVCDIGGTTTDVGAVVQGMPRMAGCFVDIAGVCTNFQMPDVASFGLGGGSLVVWQQQQQPEKQQQQAEQQQQQQQQGEQQQQCRIGPSSVGSALTSSCLVCGGNTLTASDVAVLLHDRLPGLTSRLAVAAALPGSKAPSQQQLEAAWQAMQHRLAAAVDAAKLSAAPVPLVVVGGGAGLCGDSLPGVSSIIRPQHADVANAVGAAIPQVAGTVDTLVQFSASTRQQQLEQAVQQAVSAAVAAGAELGSCEVSELEEVPVAYGPSGSTRLHIKVVGQLKLGTEHTSTAPAALAAAAAAAVPAAVSSQVPGEHGSMLSSAWEQQQQQQQQQQQGKLQEPAAQLGLRSAPAGPMSSSSGSSTDIAAAAAATMQPDDSFQPSGSSLPSSSLDQLQQYKPLIDAQGLWEVSDLDLDALAVGAQVLGAGGGGSARHNRLKLGHAIAVRAAAAAAAGEAGSGLGKCRGVVSEGQPGTGFAGGKGSSSSSSGPPVTPAVAAAAAGEGEMSILQEEALHAVKASSSTATTATTTTTTTTSSSSSSSRLRRPVILRLQALPDDALVCDVGGMGAPTVSAEKLDSHECSAAVRGLSAALPHPITALLVAEVGGGNALEPLAVGLEHGLPVVDADLMGRAFPELQMSTAAIAGVSLTPAAIADDKGNVVVMAAAASPNWAEKVLRAACTEMGCSVGLASSPMTGRLAKQVVVPGSLSLAWHIGMAVLHARAEKADPVAAVLELYQGRGQLLFQGKVVDVQRHTHEGFVRGYVRIAGRHMQQRGAAAGAAGAIEHAEHSGVRQQVAESAAGNARAQQQQQQQGTGAADAASDDDSLTIEFQNENLVAKAKGCVVASVPDLICCLETSSGVAIATEEIRYGLWLSVLVLPAHPLLRTAAALEVVGPAAFGYAGEGSGYRPVGQFPHIPTVHEVYSMA